MANISRLQKTALLLFAIGGISHMGFGLVYITADEFMSYHAQALAIDWIDLEKNYQSLLLALIKISGAGGLIAGAINLTLVVYFFRRKLSMLIWALPAASLAFQITVNYAVYMVKTNTPGHPPLTIVSIGTMIFIVATCLLFVSFRSGNA